MDPVLVAIIVPGGIAVLAIIAHWIVDDVRFYRKVREDHRKWGLD